MVDGARVFLLRTTMRENRACTAVSVLAPEPPSMLHSDLSFLRPQEQTRGHCTMAFCCTVQRSSVLVVKRPEVPCCGQPSFLSFQNLPPALLLKHPFPINNRHGSHGPFGFCRRKPVFSLNKAELRQDIAYDYDSLTDVYFTLFHILNFEGYVRFWFAAYASLRIEIPGGPLWTT
jgi:hypothetical protein